MFQPVEFVEQLFYGSIHVAARTGDLSRLRKLLEIDPALVGSRLKTMTPLHYAADNRQLDIFRLLLSRKADVNAQDQAGRTALHYCAMRCWMDGADLLLSRGASPDISSTTPFRVTRRHLVNNTVAEEFVHGTPMDVAIAMKCLEMTQLLRRYGGHRQDEVTGAH